MSPWPSVVPLPSANATTFFEGFFSPVLIAPYCRIPGLPCPPLGSPHGVATILKSLPFGTRSTSFVSELADGTALLLLPALSDDFLLFMFRTENSPEYPSRVDGLVFSDSKYISSSVEPYYSRGVFTETFINVFAQH